MRCCISKPTQSRYRLITQTATLKWHSEIIDSLGACQLRRVWESSSKKLMINPHSHERHGSVRIVEQVEVSGSLGLSK